MTIFRPFSSRLPASRPNRSAQRSGAFTLVEILVVIGIILLLAAILFPAFKGIQERGAQTTCASNMQQIYLAVRLYKDDEREFPSSLAALLPDSETLEDTGPDATNKGANIEGTGYFRKTREELVCPDDDFQVNPPTAVGTPTPIRSSYGDTSNDATKATAASSEVVADNTPWKADGTHNDAFYGTSDIHDWGRLTWNYWGYDEWGQAFRTETEALNYAKGNAALTSPALRDYDPRITTGNKNTKAPPVVAQTGYSADAKYTMTGTPPFYFNPRGFVVDTGTTAPYEEPRAANMFKYSLSNPQAPLGTIITHCTFHRLSTAKNVIGPGADQLYNTTTATTNGYDGTGARDIVLRLDGTARSYEIAKWNSVDFPGTGHGSNWQVSDF
ncbi:hypothetical protein IAD21_05224 [Abditibacteriota bacterium]|nr:hypothetical protein IAD21_05224 [Abditibacteriota bacterium]